MNILNKDKGVCESVTRRNNRISPPTTILCKVGIADHLLVDFISIDNEGETAPELSCPKSDKKEGDQTIYFCGDVLRKEAGVSFSFPKGGAR